MLLRFFELDRKVLFLHLAAHAVEKCALGRPFSKDLIFDELLRNRAGAFGKGAARNTFEKGTQDAVDVDAVMRVKAFIFDCDDSLLQRFRDFIERDEIPVGGGKSEAAHVIAVGIADIGSGFGRREIVSGSGAVAMRYQSVPQTMSTIRPDKSARPVRSCFLVM